MSLPVISVIIPTLERPEVTLATLHALQNQTTTGFEVIVLDQSASEQPQLKDVTTYSFNYVYTHIQEQGLPNARNVAARMATSDMLVFLDDDVIPESDLISQYLELFTNADESVWVIGGWINEPGSRIMSERSDIIGGKITHFGKTLKNFNAETMAPCEWVAGGNFAARKKRFLQIGGFDTNYIGNAILEDADFCFRIREAGGSVFYSPLPKIEHLRASEGGTRGFKRDTSMYYRSHNTAYFFRRHMPAWTLLLTFPYLHGVALKNFSQRMHSPLAIFYTWAGFFKGLRTPLAQLGSRL